MEIMDYLYDEEIIMRNYRTELLREGEARGRSEGISIGEVRGEARGIKKGREEKDREYRKKDREYQEKLAAMEAEIDRLKALLN